MLIVISTPFMLDTNRELSITEELFASGLPLFHLRKPEISLDETLEWISKLPQGRKDQIVWHPPQSIFGIKDGADGRLNQCAFESGLIQMLGFVKSASVQRLHLPGWLRGRLDRFCPKWSALMPSGVRFSTGIHRWSELKVLEAQQATAISPMRYTHLLVSPVFDSISKKGYPARKELLEGMKLNPFIHRVGMAVDNQCKPALAQQGQQQLQKSHRPRLIAMGGIHAENLPEVKAAGFAGAALLGAIWRNEMEIPEFKKCLAIWKN
ncbi:MAG TPA: hypothetical protein VL053_12955 [Arachidicoccus sp.]|nr:hypothetical protein [Arachidicoccus sp.]